MHAIRQNLDAKTDDEDQHVTSMAASSPGFTQSTSGTSFPLSTTAAISASQSTASGFTSNPHSGGFSKSGYGCAHNLTN
jgi:hypothetical protein